MAKVEGLHKFLELRDGKIKSGFGDKTWKVGRKYSVKGDVERCANGFHASFEPLDALGYVKGEVLAIVEASGDSDNDTNKVCYRSMKIVQAYHWTKEDSVKLAIFAAELVLDIYERKYPTDNRPRKAIEAARAWLADPASAAYAAYASSAASAAAAVATGRAVASSAAYAAAYAASYAAASSADAAAYAASYAAYASSAASYAAASSAASAEIRSKVNQWIKFHIQNLQPIEP